MNYSEAKKKYASLGVDRLKPVLDHEKRVVKERGLDVIWP